MGLVPTWSQELLRKALQAGSPAAWDVCAGLLPGVSAVRQPGEKLHKFASLLGADSPHAFHERLISFWQSGNPVLGSAGHPVSIDRKSTRLNSSHSSISYAVFCL